MPQHAVAIVLGTLLAFYGNQLPDQFWSAFAPMLLMLGYLRPRQRFILLAAAAYLWACAAFHFHLDHRLVEDYDNRATLLRGIVTDIPEIQPGRIRVYLKSPEIKGYPGTPPRLIRLSWYQDKVVPRAGEFWQFSVKLRQPRGLSNPGGFDFEAWQFSRGIDASGYIRNSSHNARLRAAGMLSVDYWRGRLAVAIDGHCETCAQRGLIKALALGFRGDLSSVQKQLLQSSGTAHLLAISGLHIGMVSLFMFALGRCCWRLGIYRSGLNRNQASSLMSIFGATVYAALAGFSLPTIRALIMLIVLLLALLLKSRVNLLQSLALAVMAILVVDPRAIGSNSFWLSVSALLVIAFVQFRLPARLRWWQQILVLQACFSLLFAPLGVLIFGQINPAGFLANIVAIPLISFIVLPLILLACLLLFAGLDAARLLLFWIDGILKLLLDYLDLLLSSGLNSVMVAYPPSLVIVLLAMMAWLLLPRMACGRIVALTGFALLVFWQPGKPQQGGFELIVFDVGMGTSALLRTRHHSLVYDFGPGKPGGYSAADWALLPALQRAAIEVPDLVVVSHVDQDHSGGLHSFVDRLPWQRLLSGTPQELQSRFSLKHRPRSCHDYPDWRWDGVEFRFLEAGAAAADSNDRSCVLLIRGLHRALLPGDIELGRENSLLTDTAETLAADILLAPHHGSDTSSSLPFLKRVNPRHVVFTLSRGNRWGFPSAAVKSRYDAIASRQYRSDIDGAISFLSSTEGLIVRAERKPVRRIWRRW